MNPVFFQTQMQRLITRFGARAFDAELIKLIWREVHDMSEPGFQRFCDVLIGSRTAHKPPLLSEFREARLNESKLRFENETRAASQTLRRAPAEMRTHMREVLKREVGGAVASLNEAVEIARLRRRASPTTPSGEEGA